MDKLWGWVDSRREPALEYGLVRYWAGFRFFDGVAVKLLEAA